MDKEMTGIYGEYFVVTRLLSWGYPAAIVPGPFKYDVVVDIDGQPVRVQVKSTNRKISKGKLEDSYAWNCRTTGGKAGKAYSRGDYDIMALVAVPEYRMVFMPFHKKQGIERKVSSMSKQQEKETWDNCLKSLGLVK